MEIVLLTVFFVVMIGVVLGVIGRGGWPEEEPKAPRASVPEPKAAPTPNAPLSTSHG